MKEKWIGPTLTILDPISDSHDSSHSS